MIYKNETPSVLFKQYSYIKSNVDEYISKESSDISIINHYFTRYSMKEEIQDDFIEKKLSKHPIPIENKLINSEIDLEYESQGEERWIKYIRKYGLTNGILRFQDPLSSIVHNGIPNSLRGKLWMQLSGASNLLISSPINYYEKIINDHKNETTVAIQDIERDLHRSLPEHYYFKTTEGRTALRRVLTAFSWHNPSIGYCQSMNVIAAFLLLYLEEEEAFYMITRITELFPDFYTIDMIGSVVYAHVFSHLIKKHFPKLHRHFDRISMDLSIVVLPWFLCLFVGYVPWNLLARIFDYLFFYGPKYLFQISLALFGVHHDNLLNADDSVDTANRIRENPNYNIEELMYLSITKYQVKDEEIQYLKHYYKRKAIEDIELTLMKQDVHDIKEMKLDKVDKSIILKYYNDYRREIYTKYNHKLLTYDSFNILIHKHIEWMKNSKYMIKDDKLIEKFTKGMYDILKTSTILQGLTFVEYFKGIYTIKYEDQENILSLIYKIMIKENKEVFDQSMFEDSYQIVHFIFKERNLIKKNIVNIEIGLGDKEFVDVGENYMMSEYNRLKGTENVIHDMNENKFKEIFLSMKF